METRTDTGPIAGLPSGRHASWEVTDDRTFFTSRDLGHPEYREGTPVAAPQSPVEPLAGQPRYQHPGACPTCGREALEPMWRKWWVWVIALVALLAIIGTITGA